MKGLRACVYVCICLSGNTITYEYLRLEKIYVLHVLDLVMLERQSSK